MQGPRGNMPLMDIWRKNYMKPYPHRKCQTRKNTYIKKGQKLPPGTAGNRTDISSPSDRGLGEGEEIEDTITCRVMGTRGRLGPTAGARAFCQVVWGYL